MTNKDVVTAIIKGIAGQANVLTIPRVFISALGGELETAVLLSQMIYWSDKGKNGWFYKSYPEWHEELGISVYKLRKAVNLLKKYSLIETDVRKVGDTPKNHFFVNMEKVVDMITDMLVHERPLINFRISESEETILSESEETILSESEETALTLNTETTVTETTTETTLRGNEKKEEPNKSSSMLEDSIHKTLSLMDATDRAFWEDRLNIKAPNREQRATAEEYRERTVAAVKAFGRNTESLSEFERDVGIWINTLPDDVREIARVFCIMFGRLPLKKEKAFWITEFLLMRDLGIDADAVRLAMEHADESHLVIKSPKSLSSIAESKVRDRNKKPKYDVQEVWTSEGRVE